MKEKERVVELINQLGNSLDSPAYAQKVVTECGKEILQIVSNLEKQVEGLKFDCCMYENQIHILKGVPTVEVTVEIDR